jgi:hypothetical protein
MGAAVRAAAAAVVDDDETRSAAVGSGSLAAVNARVGACRSTSAEEIWTARATDGASRAGVVWVNARVALPFDFVVVSTSFADFTGSVGGFDPGDASGSAGFSSVTSEWIGSAVASGSVAASADSYDVVSCFSSVLSPDLTLGFSSVDSFEVAPAAGRPVLLPVVDDADPDEGFEESGDDEFVDSPAESDGSAAATPVDTATPRPTASVSPLSRDTFLDVTMTCLLRPEGTRSRRQSTHPS